MITIDECPLDPYKPTSLSFAIKENLSNLQVKGKKLLIQKELWLAQTGGSHRITVPAP